VCVVRIVDSGESVVINGCKERDRQEWDAAFCPHATFSISFVDPQGLLEPVGLQVGEV